MQKRVLITGGTGSIGRAFIKELHEQCEIYNLSRGGEGLVSLSREFPKVKNYLGSIEDKSFVLSSFRKAKPEIVVHLAAVSHANKSNYEPNSAYENSLTTLKNSLIASSQNSVKHFIFLSSHF